MKSLDIERWALMHTEAKHLDSWDNLVDAVADELPDVLEEIQAYRILIKELQVYLKAVPSSGPPEGSPRQIGMLTVSMEALFLIDEKLK